MSDHWILNASPLIVFGKIGRLNLFSQLAEEIIVPLGVAQEILAGPENDAARLAIEGNMFQLVDVPEPKSELATWDLGLGETAVLSFALEHPDWIAGRRQ